MLPNFMVIGAAKSGTTSLYNYLAQHPDIFMSAIKEPNFFALEGGRPNLKGPLDEARIFNLAHRKTVTARTDYEALFAGAGGAKAVGEASPRYLYSPLAAAAIADACGPIRVIAILREPVARAWSHFEMNRRRGLEPIGDFEAALDAEAGRMAEGFEWDWHYLAVGRYAGQLERYIDRFGAANVLVLLYEDLAREPAATLARCFAFLGVDPAFRPDMEERHLVGLEPGRGPLSRLAFAPEDTTLGRLAIRMVPPKLGYRTQLLLQRLIGRQKSKAGNRPGAELRARLAAELAPERERLGRLIDRDLSAWGEC
jgi:hypothetical protein